MSMSPLAINSMLSSHNNAFRQTLPFTPAPTKLVRKHYSEHEPHYEHHEEHHKHKKHSRSVALTALTLLAFLFFLHILQQCLHDQVEMATTTPTTVVMQANFQIKKGANFFNKEAQDRFGESEEETSIEEPQLTTPYGITEERKMVTRGANKQENTYQYEKVHIPIKMKVIEKNKVIKKG